ncbi:uncharacterized protein LOC126696954 [Quercus robur]|uniref:uncharacterized protein LOC126696954 n=1 Tax=Quercus robur TaxID=38942 RepID=UPI00216248F3|nr:uncharacterized protein LOC126696954 [Quercus robur]
MSGGPLRHNQSLHCQYHQEKGHTTEDCRTLWNHLEQLVKEGKLQQFLYWPNGQKDQSRSGARGNTPSRHLLGTINVIFAAPGRIGSHPSRVMSVARLPPEDSHSESKRARMEVRPLLSFSDEDKIGTIQPHDDALVVTLRIRGYGVKRPEDLTVYDSPLVSFDGKVVIPKGQIRMLIQASSEVVEVDFIVINIYSPYTAIMAKPWLHTLGAISSTLHQKMKYSSGDWIEELVGDQSMARQCFVSAILH